MSKFAVFLLVTIARTALCHPSVVERENDDPVVAGNDQVYILSTPDGRTDINRSPLSPYPITWHGGAVMANPVIYIVWYGTWTAAQQNIVLNFVRNIGKTSWWAINKPYGVGAITYKGYASDNYSQGKNLTTNSVWDAINNIINRGTFPLDTNAIYLLLSSSDVTMADFCTLPNGICGWHNFASTSGASYKFGWIGLPPPNCPCILQIPSPNGDTSVDAAINIIAHELAEAATDPCGGGWCYSGNNTSCLSDGAVENGDQCAWYFPNLAFVYPNGYFYNLNVGFSRYLVQANWNLISKTCAMS